LQKNYNPKLKRYVHEIYAGGYQATREQNIVFSAILGSCISVCLKDRTSGVTGMNHFMLPGKPRTGKKVLGGDARYGGNSMEMLIASMLKIGAKESALEAKVFGGGKLYDVALSNIADMNIDFIAAYLKATQVPVLASNVGGRHGRKLFFFPDTFAVYVKQINMTEIPAEAGLQQEKRLLRSAKADSVP